MNSSTSHTGGASSPPEPPTAPVLPSARRLDALALLRPVQPLHRRHVTHAGAGHVTEERRRVGILQRVAVNLGLAADRPAGVGRGTRQSASLRRAVLAPLLRLELVDPLVDQGKPCLGLVDLALLRGVHAPLLTDRGLDDLLRSVGEQVALLAHGLQRGPAIQYGRAVDRFDSASDGVVHGVLHLGMPRDDESSDARRGWWDRRPGSHGRCEHSRPTEPNIAAIRPAAPQEAVLPGPLHVARPRRGRTCCHQLCLTTLVITSNTTPR